MKPIAADIVDNTWQRVSALPDHDAPRLIQRMSREQPAVLAYLMAVDNDLFNDDERKLLLFLGVVVWQIMLQGSKRLRPITEEMLEKAKARNLKMSEYLQKESAGGFEEATRTIVSNYSQPEVLRYIVEALMGEPEEGCIIRDEYKGIMMLDLKTIIDCFSS